MIKAYWSQLPNELIILVTHHVDFADLISLSAVNHRLRILLLKTVFRTIRFDNQAKHEGTIDETLKRHGAYADKLCFELYLTASPDPSNANFIQLSKLSRTLLDGQSLPNISSLVVNFYPKEYVPQSPLGLKVKA
jgi:hypothetical protein